MQETDVYNGLLKCGPGYFMKIINDDAKKYSAIIPGNIGSQLSYSNLHI